MSEVSSPVVNPRIDAAKKKMAPRPGLESMFAPRSIAVIGATDREGTVGRSVLSNLLESEKKINIYAVNPSHAEVLGIKTERISGTSPPQSTWRLWLRPRSSCRRSLANVSMRE